MNSPADRLRRDRESVATGQLTLDRDKARQKLRMFRLPSPYQYVLQFVRAASVLNARQITFDIRTRSMRCDFDAVFNAELLADIWSPMFEERSSIQHHAVRNLALGIASAQALNPRQVEVRSGATRLTLRGEEQALDAIDPSDQTTIVIDQKFHFGQVLSFFTGLMGQLPEVHELSRYCRFALIDVIANDEIVSDAFGQAGHRVTETTPRGEASVIASFGLAHTTLVLMRDDVEVARLNEPRRVAGVHAGLNSRNVATDLSGLGLRASPDAEWNSLTAVIHRSILEWLQSHRDFASPDDLREELERVASFLIGQNATAVPAATQELVEWLFAQPLFRSAIIGNEDKWMRLDEPFDGQPVRFSTSRVVLPDADDVLFLRKGSPLGVLLERAQIATQDVTQELEARAIYARNRQRWLHRPADVVHEFTPWRNREVVRDRTLRGAVEIAPGRGRAQIVLGSRVLKQTSTALPFAYVIDGQIDDLQPNEYFDGVTRDERFDRLALALLKKTTLLFDRLHLHDRISVLERILNGSFETDVLNALGYDDRGAGELLDQASLRGDDPLGLELAGPLATLKLFDRYSLTQLVKADKAPVFVRPSDPMRLEPGRIKLALTAEEKRIVRFVRPDAGEIEDTLAREQARASFENQPPYRHPDLHAIWQHRVEGHHFDIQLDLLPMSRRRGSYNTTTVVFIYEGRLLAREQRDSEVGEWYIAVRCDGVEPHPSYGSVVPNDGYWAIREAITRYQEIALREWMDEQITRGFVAREYSQMFLDMATDLPDEDIVLPARRYDGNEWVRTIATVPELNAAAARGDGTLEWAPATGELSGLFLPGDLVVEASPKVLRDRWLLRDVRLVRADVMPVSASLRRYTERAPYRSALDDALYDWHSTVDGFHLHVGLYAGESRLQVEFLWRRRVLDSEVLDSPGRFIAVVNGEAIGANEELTAVSEGRDAAIEAVQVGVERLIEAACFQIAERRAGYLSRRLERVRDELLEIASRASGDEPWWPTLEAAPLIETNVGRRSLRDRRELEPTASPQLLGRLEGILSTASDGRSELLGDFTLAGLRWSEPQQTTLCNASGHGVTVRKDHPLCELAAKSGDVGAAFVASCVYTRINAYYAEISDTDELTFQKSLLRVVE